MHRTMLHFPLFSALCAFVPTLFHLSPTAAFSPRSGLGSKFRSPASSNSNGDLMFLNERSLGESLRKSSIIYSAPNENLIEEVIRTQVATRFDEPVQKRIDDLELKIYEADLRSKVAEDRVREIQLAINIAKAERDAEFTKLKTSHDLEKSSLVDKLKSAADQFQRFKLDANSALNKAVAEGEQKVSKLEQDLARAKNELEEKSKNMELLKTDVFNLDRFLEMEQQRRMDEIKEAKQKLSETEADFSNRLARQKSEAGADLKNAKGKARSVLEDTRRGMTRQLLDTKTEAADKLWETRKEARKEIEELGNVISARNKKISFYDSERVSIRKLIRLSAALTSGRAAKRVKRVREGASRRVNIIRDKFGNESI